MSRRYATLLRETSVNDVALYAIPRAICATESKSYAITMTACVREDGEERGPVISPFKAPPLGISAKVEIFGLPPGVGGRYYLSGGCEKSGFLPRRHHDSARELPVVYATLSTANNKMTFRSC